MSSDLQDLRDFGMDKNPMALQVYVQIRDELTRIGRKTDEVNERVIRLEERGRRIEQIEAEVKVIAKDVELLKVRNIKEDSVKSVGNWVVQNWASLGAMIALLAVLVKLIGTKPLF